MSQEFDWAPSIILKVTLQQLAHYYEELQIYRKVIRNPAESLSLIQQALFDWLGVKIQEPAVMDKQIATTPFPKLKISRDELVAWEKDGYPPLAQWRAKRSTNG